ncbi:MAG: hypothetical protein R2865_02935 [Deinococcales bacterium]
MLYTVGCSTIQIRTPSTFFKIMPLMLLLMYVLNLSRYTPQFNQHQLKKTLREAGIMYVSLATEFGAHRIELEAYSEGRVDFSKVRELEKFKAEY